MFKLGERVACIDPGRDINLIKDCIYTVGLVLDDSQGSKSVELLEVRPPQPFFGYLASRFRKLKPEELNTLEKQLEYAN